MADIHAAGAVMFLIEKKVPKYLVLRSSHHSEWGPPKGHADDGESEVQTAMREIREETGFQPTAFVQGFREVLAYKVDKKKKRLKKEVVFFLCEMPSAQVKISDEHVDARWGTMAELETMISHEDLKIIIRKADAAVRARL